MANQNRAESDRRPESDSLDRAWDAALSEGLATVTARLGDRAPLTLLAVWAHPDDETYLSAALMHRITASGGRVVVATATLGELGGTDGADPDRVGQQRERELRAALAAVGVHDLRLLGLADGSCDRADADLMALAVAELIADVQPDLIIGFGPDGITGHPDHTATSRWVLRAWHPDHLAPLLLATMTDEFIAANADLHHRIGLSMGRPLASVPSDDIVLSIVPNDVERTAKREALHCHESQVSQLIALVGYQTFHDWWTDEVFRAPTAADISWAWRPYRNDPAVPFDPTTPLEVLP